MKSMRNCNPYKQSILEVGNDSFIQPCANSKNNKRKGKRRHKDLMTLEMK
jgi:hypothetical protein